MSARPGFAFSTIFRVRYSEIDAQNVVFNSRYLEYADVAITEYWRWADLGALGAEWVELQFHIVRALVEYRQPFRHDDPIAAFVRTDRIGTSSLTTRIDLCHGETGALHATIELVNVCVDLATGRSMALPDRVRARLVAIDGTVVT